MTSRFASESLTAYQLLENVSGAALERLTHLRALRGEVEDMIAGEVAMARRVEGASWAQVGGALGTTRQGAQDRYGA
jgi:hypothetical protein